MNADASTRSWSLAELAEETGLPRRTIRYYIARGLLDGPVRAGRGAEYTQEHLERLKEIQRLQASGVTLAEIASARIGGEPDGALPEAVPVQSFALGPDVTVLVRAGCAPWRLKLIREALRDLTARLVAQERGTNNADDV